MNTCTGTVCINRASTLHPTSTARVLYHKHLMHNVASMSDQLLQYPSQSFPRIFPFEHFHCNLLDKIQLNAQPQYNLAYACNSNRWWALIVPLQNPKFAGIVRTSTFANQLERFCCNQWSWDPACFNLLSQPASIRRVSTTNIVLTCTTLANWLVAMQTPSKSISQLSSQSSIGMHLYRYVLADGETTPKVW